MASMARHAWRNLTCSSSKAVPLQLVRSAKSGRRRRTLSAVCQSEVGQPSAVDCSRSLAAVRAAEDQQAEPICSDPYAATLASQVMIAWLGSMLLP